VVTVSHEALLVAVQLHPAVVVTVEVCELPTPAEVTVVGETVNVQVALPCCVTVTDWPAMVNVPVRA
jgi:hypothetical protein